MDEVQRKQVSECRRLLELGHSAEWLRSLGYAEAAIQVAAGRDPENLDPYGAQNHPCPTKS